MPLSAGDKVGPYVVSAPIGAGGMGEVYKARDTRLDRTVAVKVLPEEIAKREDLRARFEREARAVASLNHPNICSLFDIGRHEEKSYMVMELIEGETLAQRIGKGALPLDQALKYATQIAVAPDGKRFLVLVPVGSSQPLEVVVNWTALLKKGAAAE